jgi:hypothetical protein
MGSREADDVEARTANAHEVLVAVPPDGGSLLGALRSEAAVGARPGLGA